jgi:two-component system, cell cycle response regulator
MRISLDPARRSSTIAVVALTEAATIAAYAAIGGGSWLFSMLLGAILGAVATLTVIGTSGSPRGAVAPMVPETLIDPVTGLPNTEKLLADLKSALGGGGQDRPLTLYLFALDGFKDYNDAYGDACGDALLGWLARKMRGAVGDYGNAYRTRGGNFALLAGGSERFTTALCASAASALNEIGDGFQISCDLGKVALPAEAASPQAALELAVRRAHKGSTERHVKSGRRAPADRTEARRLVRPRDDVAALAIRIAHTLRVPPGDIEQLEAAVRLCDVGNVALPGAVLEYSGRLLGDEWQFILLHTLVGERLLAGNLGMEAVARLVRSSHERWDGAGYPDGLAGEAIPIGSRIVFVCSAFDDMTLDRPHHSALEPADALAQLELGAGTQFDPEVVRAFREELAPADPVELALDSPTQV